MAVPAGGRRTAGLGTVFLVLFVDLVGFGLTFPLYAEMLRHYGQQEEGLLHLLMALVDGPFPQATGMQRAALFGGLLTGLYAGIQFVAAPFWGRLSDRVGRRPVLLISLLGSCMANALWAVSGSFGLLLLSRAIAGLMTGNVAVANAAVADVTDARSRGKGMAIVGLAFGLGFVVGPALGGMLGPVRIDTPALAAWGINPFSVPALAALALSLLNLWWTAARFGETLPPERRQAGAGHARPLNPLAIIAPDLPRAAVTVNILGFLHTLLFSGMEATLVFLATERLGFTMTGNGMLFAVMGLVAAISQGAVFRPFSGRLGEARLTRAGFLLMVPGFALIALVHLLPQAWLLWTGVAVLSLGTGLVFPGLSTLASLHGDPARQGWTMGTFRSATSLGRAAGPLLGAIAYFSLSQAAPYWIAAGGMLLPALLLSRLPPARPAA